MWEEISEFKSPSEYERFTKYINDLINEGNAKEVDPDPQRRDGYSHTQRWFQNTETNELWRLVEPDFPFKGVWKPVRKRGEL